MNLCSGGVKFVGVYASDISAYNNDCNNMTDAGLYYIREQSTHAPTSNKCTLLVIPVSILGDNQIFQFFFTGMATTQDPSYLIYFRARVANQWTGWFQIDGTPLS